MPRQASTTNNGTGQATMVESEKQTFDGGHKITEATARITIVDMTSLTSNFAYQGSNIVAFKRKVSSV